jgi:hypothetical protein
VSDITLPRAVGELVQDLIDHAYNDGVEELARPSEQTTKALDALFAALAEPPATREPATAAEIVKAGGECAVVDDEYLLDFRDGWRAAERHHGIRAREQQPGAAGMSGAEADRMLTDAIGRQPCRYPACQDADGRCPRIFAGKCSGPGGVVA